MRKVLCPRAKRRLEGLVETPGEGGFLTQGGSEEAGGNGVQSPNGGF